VLNGNVTKEGQPLGEAEVKNLPFRWRTEVFVRQ